MAFGVTAAIPTVRARERPYMSGNLLAVSGELVAMNVGNRGRSDCAPRAAWCGNGRLRRDCGVVGRPAGVLLRAGGTRAVGGGRIVAIAGHVAAPLCVRGTPSGAGAL